MQWDSVYIHDKNCVTPLGLDIQSNWQQLMRGTIGITQVDVGNFKGIWAGKIQEDTIRAEMPELAYTHLERMLIMAAKPIVQKHRPGLRTAFILSTTKGNVSFLRAGSVQEAELTVLAQKIASHLGFLTEPIVVSHACVSGVLALGTAKRLIQMGCFDDAVVLAGDALSEFVVSGFQAFQAMSQAPCRPFDLHRTGVSLGEAAACTYVSKVKGVFQILGDSFINDANHISGPSRTGEGLYRSILGAIKEAEIDSLSIEHISAHGTATPYNDEMEAIAFNRLHLQHVPLNSLKGYYGHTLGASGLLELVVAMHGMEENVLIPTAGFQEIGVSQPVHVIQKRIKKEVKRMLKTASGFGGSNAAIIVEKK